MIEAKLQQTHQQDWYGTWFDSPYYHVLYEHRDDREARFLIDNLIEKLGIVPGWELLDLACGKGRHSIYLNKKGITVTGVDLSEQNIAQASTHANAQLQFFRHDMRKVFRPQAFDAVLNLFTSFGYFSSWEENQLAIKAAAENLKPNGYLVIDFLNAPQVVKNLPKQDTVFRGGHVFHTKKYFAQGAIHKEIKFRDIHRDYSFRESVMAYSLEDFREFFAAAGLKCQAVFGNYKLEAFQDDSDRLIMIAEKK